MTIDEETFVEIAQHLQKISEYMTLVSYELYIEKEQRASAWSDTFLANLMAMNNEIGFLFCLFKAVHEANKPDRPPSNQ